MKDGGPAFPTENFIDHGPNALHDVYHPGMSLRDWFAGMALTGVMLKTTAEPQLLASLAYDLADAMLKVREKGGES